MEKQSKILVTGASGLIGGALVRLLKAEDYENIFSPSRNEIDWTEQEAVQSYFYHTSPDYVFHLAAQVGGIQCNNSSPVQFSYNNTLMYCDVFEQSYQSGVKKLLFPGSACAYPKKALQPIKEENFLKGKSEITNIAYALAKQNGIIMAQSYAKQYGMNVVLPMVANTYGKNDRSSHVIPMMMEKFSAASDEVVLWGTGFPLREFIHADDVASAFLFLMQNYDSSEIINVGTQEEISIRQLSQWIGFDKYGYTGKITFDVSKPDGVARKILDSSKIRSMGWEPKIKLYEGIMSL